MRTRQHESPITTREDFIGFDANSGPTYDRTRTCSTQRRFLQRLREIRSDRFGGRLDRFRREARRRSNERSPGRDPVRASAPWIALGSAGQLGHPLTPWRQETNIT